MWRRSRRLLVSAAAFALLASAAPARALSFGAVADTVVDSANSGSNYGFLDFAEVGTQGLPKNAIDRALLRFDLSALPVGTPIARVRLQLFITATSADPLGLPVTVASLASDFDEATVTWNTQPLIEPGPTRSAVMNAMAGDLFQIDVTALVEAQRVGSSPDLVLLRIAPTTEVTTATRYFDFRTKEFVGDDMRAQLEIDIGAAAAPALSPSMLLAAVGLMLAVAAIALRRTRLS